uniref:AAA domain-containing protein n=1 Tax=Rhizophagus irregularis (strain DAOM 181602 / DAOM 197198 / MUCL 43194) TaxID=747089 RepID=U9UTA3_RHIID
MKYEVNKLAVAISRVITGGNVISFISGKGGVLKTTNAQNLGASLASEGYKVAILDLDPQKTAENWGLIRKAYIKKQEEKIRAKVEELKGVEKVNKLVAKQLTEAAKKLAMMKNLEVLAIDPNSINWKDFEAMKSKYDFIICDTSGHLEFIGTTKDVIKNSDIVFVPFNNSIDDFNVKLDVKKTIASCGGHKAKIFSLVVDMNEKQNSKGISQKMLANVADTMPIAPVKLFKRASWVDVKYRGLGVVEVSKDKVATEQFKNLTAFVINELNAMKAA